MRAVKTILSISFLLLAANVVADDTEVLNELPDEIKNLDKKQVVEPVFFQLPIYPVKAYKLKIQSDVWIKLKVGKDEKADSALVIYCDKPNNGFEQAALKAVQNSFYPVKRKKRKLNRDWFYTIVSFVWHHSGWKTSNIGSTENPELECPDSTSRSFKQIKDSYIDFPQKARTEGVNGLVSFKVLLSKAGNPIKVYITHTTDHSWEWGFNESAIKTVTSFRFLPKVCDNQPIEYWVTFPLPYKMSSKEFAKYKRYFNQESDGK